MTRKFPPFITAATFLAQQVCQERRGNSRASPVLLGTETRAALHVAPHPLCYRGGQKPRDSGVIFPDLAIIFSFLQSTRPTCRRD